MRFQDVEKVIVEVLSELKIKDFSESEFDEFVRKIFIKMQDWERKRYETVSYATKNREFEKTSQC